MRFPWPGQIDTSLMSPVSESIGVHEYCPGGDRVEVVAMLLLRSKDANMSRIKGVWGSIYLQRVGHITTPTT
jgi:hypothetical protein